VVFGGLRHAVQLMERAGLEVRRLRQYKHFWHNYAPFRKVLLAFPLCRILRRNAVFYNMESFMQSLSVIHVHNSAYFPFEDFSTRFTLSGGLPFFFQIIICPGIVFQKTDMFI
jgi:hypothetical protein